MAVKNLEEQISLSESTYIDVDSMYPYPPLDKLLDRIPGNSRFALIIAAANRARSILDAIVAITKRSTNVPEEIKSNPEAFLPKLSHYKNAYFDNIEMKYKGKLFVIALEEINEGLIEVQYPEENQEASGDILLKFTLGVALGKNPSEILFSSQE